MNKIETGGQAFATMAIDSDGSIYGDNGMTMRDYFAAKAMQGMMADHTRDLYPLDLAKHGYVIADAMLEARK